MKLITLNLWGGRVKQPLIDFLLEQEADTAIFCFQEVYKTEQNEEFEKNTITLVKDKPNPSIRHKYPVAIDPPRHCRCALAGNCSNRKGG